MIKYILNAELLNGTSLARGVKEPNDKLNQVYVWDEDGMRNYMATNGHILFWAKDEIKDGEGAIDGKLALFWEGKIKRKKYERGVSLTYDTQGIGSIRSVSGDKICFISDVQPPENWLKCIPPRDSEKLTVFKLFNPQYLGYIRDFIGTGFFNCPQTLTNENKWSPAVWYYKNKIACIMPIRC